MLQCLDTQPLVSAVKPLKEVLSKPHQKQQLLAKIKLDYEQAHTDNPVGDFSLKDWEDILKRDYPDECLSSVLMIDGKIIAYIMLHQSDKAFHYEIGWAGADETYLETEVLKQLLYHQLLSLREKNVQTVEIEADSTNAAAMRLFDFIELDKKLTWNSYIRLNPNKEQITH